MQQEDVRKHCSPWVSSTRCWAAAFRGRTSWTGPLGSRGPSTGPRTPDRHSARSRTRYPSLNTHSHCPTVTVAQSRAGRGPAAALVLSQWVSPTHCCCLGAKKMMKEPGVGFGGHPPIWFGWSVVWNKSFATSQLLHASAVRGMRDSLEASVSSASTLPPACHLADLLCNTEQGSGKKNGVCSRWGSTGTHARRCRGITAGSFPFWKKLYSYWTSKSVDPCKEHSQQFRVKQPRGR
jgi:hypothetical protein